jgi:hypothetical protein
MKVMFQSHLAWSEVNGIETLSYLTCKWPWEGMINSCEIRTSGNSTIHQAMVFLYIWCWCISGDHPKGNLTFMATRIGKTVKTTKIIGKQTCLN